MRNGGEKRDEGNERFQACKVVLLPEDLRKILKVQLPLKTKIFERFRSQGLEVGAPFTGGGCRPTSFPKGSGGGGIGGILNEPSSQPLFEKEL